MRLEICFPLTIWTWDWMTPLVEFVGGHGPWPSDLLDIMSCAWIRYAISIWFVFEVNILWTVWCLCVKFGDWRSFAHLCPWTQLWPSDFKVKLFFSLYKVLFSHLRHFGTGSLLIKAELNRSFSHCPTIYHDNVSAKWIMASSCWVVCLPIT